MSAGGCPRFRGILAGLVALLFSLSSNWLFAQTARVVCSSEAGERQHCAADTSGGVALQKSNGTGECLLGKTWGYDDAGIWVSDGCGGEFVLGQATPVGAAAAPAAPSKKKPEELYAPLFAKLTPEASEKVRKGNYERLFDEARRKVRAWEKENVE